MASVALLCPGQGAQHPRMLELALSTAAGREALGHASDAAAIDIVARVQAGHGLFEPVFAQVCIVATTTCTWQALARELPRPDLVAGYSVGEVSAWCCAGSWSVSEAMAVILTRARLMADASPPGAAMMAVTGLRGEALMPILRRHALHVAIEVDDDHWVLAGLQPDLDAAGTALLAAGGLVHPLPVSVPSHTPLLVQAGEGLRKALAGLRGREPDAPVLRGVDGRSAFAYADAREAIAAAVAQPIRWRACMDEAMERGVTAALELPPGGALTRMLRHRGGIDARAVADFRSIDGVARWLERLA